VPWLRYMPQSMPAAERKATTVSLADIVRRRNFWAASAGHFCSNYPFYFLIVWLPLYLVRERHLSMKQMAVKATFYYLAYAVIAPVAGWVADKCVRAGRDVSTIRKTAMGLGHALSAIGVLLASTSDERVWMTGLIIMGMGGGLVGPNIYVFAQTLSGPSVAGKWIGLQNSLSNFAGVVVGPLTGWIVDRTGHFGSAFSICAVAALLGGLFWVVGVTRVEPIEWATQPELLKAASEAA